MLGFVLFLTALISPVSSNDPSLPDADGWVTLEREESQAPVEEEEGWVLFSLTLDKEKFWIRLPQDPIYHYTSSGVNISARGDGAQIHISIEKCDSIVTSVENLLTKAKSRIGTTPFFVEATGDTEKAHLAYLDNQKWVCEDLFRTPHYLYTVRTEQEISSSTTLHETVVSSLNIFAEK
ncbi:MAG: hypothetical protein KGI80_02160 [Verrucomicrobiota bacterium]|nr:hypothetical protein [Verrucomicrobiota bacterium]